MSLVSLQNAGFDFGRERILAQANLNLFAGVKYGLVGDNGAGKTTLLALVSGELPLHAGSRQVATRAAIRHLRQETTFDPAREGAEPLRESVLRAAFPDELRIEAELARLAEQLLAANPAETEALALRQGRLQADYERRHGYGARARLDATLHGLGLPDELWDRPLGELSGGERRRAALASVLLAGGDLLLLDEPTNHLDLEACEWLEEFLVRLPAAAVVVSHDRQFLDRVTTQTIHLGGGRLTTWSGPYSFFARARAEQERQEWVAYERQQERIRKTEDFIRRNIAGQKTKQAQSRRRALAREERLDRPAAARGAWRLRLEPQRESGGLVIETEGLGKGYDGTRLWDGVSLLVARGERIGLLGPNGCGKTTLLRVLAGLELPDRGVVRLGHNVDVGYYDQLLRSVNDSRTVLEEMAAVDPAATLGELRGFLAAFGFGADALDRPVGALSGGERARLALLRLIKEGHNTLLLDEPTNHLDVRAREALEEALAGYEGTLVVVSHDRRFLDRVIGRLLVFRSLPGGDSRVESFAGNYAAWHEREVLARAAAASAPAAAAEAAPPAPLPGARPGPGPAADGGALSKNEVARRQRWMTEAEAAIADLEAERDALCDELANPRLDPARLKDVNSRLARIEAELAGKLALWEQWGREIEGSSRD